MSAKPAFPGWVFWIPPRQNPEVFMRQLQQGRRQGDGNGGGQSTVILPAPTE